MDFASLPIVQGGAVGVLLVVVVMVMRGMLVPRSVVDDVRKDRDERLADAEREAERGWAAYESERASHEKTRQALVDQVRAAALPALAAAETTEKILSELQNRPGPRPGARP